MGLLDNESIPRRKMILFFVIDTSGSMIGKKIGSVNDAIENVLPMIGEISDENPDAEINVAALEFSTGTRWLYDEPKEAKDFIWQKVEADGLTSLGEACEELNKSLEPCYQFTDIISDAKASKDKNLISTITALKGKVKEIKTHGINTDFCDDELNALFYGAIPCDYHKTIVATNYRHIITTNYDALLEKAAKQEGYTSLLTRAYSYTEQQNLSMAIYSGKTAIIHAHGKIADIKLDQFVLTEEDYLAIMKHNPGFRLIINSIFLTKFSTFRGIWWKRSSF